METTSNNFKEFEKGIENNFIGPKIIDKKDWISSFNNMVNTTPDLKKIDWTLASAKTGEKIRNHTITDIKLEHKKDDMKNISSALAAEINKVLKAK